MCVCVYVAYQISEDMFRRWLYEYVFTILFGNKHKTLQRACDLKLQRNFFLKYPK